MSCLRLNAGNNLDRTRPLRSGRYPGLYRSVQPNGCRTDCVPAARGRRQSERAHRSGSASRTVQGADSGSSIRAALSSRRRPSGYPADPSWQTSSPQGQDSVIAVRFSAKYSSLPGAGLADRFDQSLRTCDYHPCPAPHPGLRHNFPATIRRFP